MRWRVTIDHPDQWSPHSLGGQPIYELDVTVSSGRADAASPDTELRAGPETGAGPETRADPSPSAAAAVSDRRVLTTGLRQIRIRNFVATVNGERLFLKGANLGPTRRALAETTADELARDVTLAREAGLDLLRVHAHITRPELYDAADRQGVLIWQDLPLQWGYGQVRRQAVRQARRAVTLLGHHPSVALWCGHNEPLALALTPGGAHTPKTTVRLVAGQLLPSWNKTALDRSIRRTLERSDGSREVVAHSGILPHPAWGTDSHLYFGWYHGDEADFAVTLARFPVLARFVSEFGAQAVPEEAGFMQPERWPDLDWDGLEAHHALQRAIFEERVPPGESVTFDDWRAATQALPGQPVAPSHRDPASPQVPPDGRLLPVPAGRRPGGGELVDPRLPTATEGWLPRGGECVRSCHRHREPAARRLSARRTGGGRCARGQRPPPALGRRGRPRLPALAGRREGLALHRGRAGGQLRAHRPRRPRPARVGAPGCVDAGAHAALGRWQRGQRLPEPGFVSVRVARLRPSAQPARRRTGSAYGDMRQPGCSSLRSNLGLMARFLSSEWFDEVARCRPRRPGDDREGAPEDLVLEQVVRETPDGAVRYLVVVSAGSTCGGATAPTGMVSRSATGPPPSLLPKARSPPKPR